jgi:two-component system, NarL family, nitrate/nitrite response regulator NarL
MNVFIVDDHQIMIDALQTMLSLSEGIAVVGTTTRPDRVLPQLAALEVDVLLTDIGMPGLNGLELARQVRASGLPVRVLALSMSEDGHTVRQMLEAGALGYVPKTASRAELEQAIRTAFTGQRYLAPGALEPLLGAVAQPAPPGEPLTPRELEVLQLVAHELPNKLIADRLNISERTVETHRRNIFQKTGTQTVVGLLKFALAHKLVQG